MQGFPLIYTLRESWFNNCGMLSLLLWTLIVPNLHAQAASNEDPLGLPPSISQIHPQDKKWLNVGVDSTINLVWEVSGDKPIRHILLKNGNVVKQQTHGNFQIKLGNLPSIAEYSMKAINIHGESISDIIVIKAVVNPPVIEDHPYKVYAILGEPLEINIKASGFGLSYQWHKDLWPIQNETHPSLVIEKTKLEDGGDYVLTVSNFKDIKFAPVEVVFSVQLTVRKDGDNIRIEANAGDLKRFWMLQRSSDLRIWRNVKRYFVPGHLVIEDIPGDDQSYYYRMIAVD